MLKWRSRAEQLRRDTKIVALRNKFVSEKCVRVRGEAWFPAAEARVFALFGEQRDKGLPCSGLRFTMQMRRTLAELFRDKSADDFVAGSGWRTRFVNRFNLTMRLATNVMALFVAERVPKCLRFFEVIQQVCADGGGMNAIWGRFPPHHRFNADEVPIEFGATLARTAEIKGAKRVWVTHPRHPIEPRECTIMPLFCGGAALPFSSILLRCTPKRVAADRVDPRTAHHGPTNALIQQLRIKYPAIDIYCQVTGYMDAITFLTWFTHT